MAGGDVQDNAPRHDPGEERLLRRLRLIAVSVILTMIVMLVVVDSLGRLFIDPRFHASELIFGTLVGAVIPLLGVVGVTSLPGRK
jgi:hypothetical protein